MFLDLHSHSVSSDDSRATVDGFVLTEHRKFDSHLDYSS